MGVLNFCGFETGDSSEAQSTTGTTSIQTSVVRTGAYALRVNPTTSANGNYRFAKMSTAGVATTAFGVATLYHRFYFRIATAPAANEEQMYVILDDGGSDKCYLTLTSSRTIKAYNNAGSLIASGSTVLSTNTWYRIELQTSTGSGSQTFILKIDGTTEINSTGNQLTNNHGSVRLGKATNLNSQSIDFYYDDWIVSDSGFLGAGECRRMAPDSNGSTAQWTSGSNSSNYLEVDEIPTDTDTTYIMSTGSAGDVHLVGLESTSSAGISGTINAAKAWARVRENTSTTTATRVRIKSSSSTSDTASNDPTTTYANRFNLALTDPATSTAWTTSGLDAVEIGVKEDNAVQTRCTTISMFVDFVPSASISTDIPAGSIVIAKQAPTTILTNNKWANIPSGQINITAQAPTTVVTHNIISNVPAGSILLNAQAPTTVKTANHVANIPVGAIHLTAQPPSTNIKISQVLIPEAKVYINAQPPTTVMTGNVVSRPPAGNLVMTAFSPSTTLTGNHIANIPVATLQLDANDPSTTITGHFVGRVPAGQIHIHGQAPETLITSGLLANIPVGEILLDGKDPSTILTLNFLSRIPAGSILLNAQAPTVVVTNNKVTYPPTAQIVTIPQAPTTILTNNRISQIPEGSLVFQAYAPSVSITQHFISRVSNAELVLEGQDPTVILPLTRGVPLYTFLADTLVNSFTVERLPDTFEAVAVERLFYA